MTTEGVAELGAVVYFTDRLRGSWKQDGRRCHHRRNTAVAEDVEPQLSGMTSNHSSSFQTDLGSFYTPSSTSIVAQYAMVIVYTDSLATLEVLQRTHQ